MNKRAHMKMSGLYDQKLLKVGIKEWWSVLYESRKAL